jgi:hypothetical protein
LLDGVGDKGLGRVKCADKGCFVTGTVELTTQEMFVFLAPEVVLRYDLVGSEGRGREEGGYLRPRRGGQKASGSCRKAL